MYIMLNTLLDEYEKNNSAPSSPYRKRTKTLGCLKDLNKTTSDNFNLLIEDSIEQLNNYNRKFNVILNIKFGEKLGKDDNSYYVFQNGYLQQMTRWWYSENRYKTYEYIQYDLDDFTKYLEKYYNEILLSEDFKTINIKKKSLFIKLANFNNRLSEFIKKMVVGIYTLKRTYTHAIDSTYIFGSIQGDQKAKEIIELIDFKISRMLYYKNQFLQIFQ